MKHLFALLLISIIGNQTCAASSLCAELRQSVDRSAAVGKVLEPIETSQDDWNLRFPNVDLDNDDLNDQVLMFKSESPSLRPGDSSRLSVTLSSSARSFNFVSPHIALIRHRSKYFIVGTDYAEGGFSKSLEISEIVRGASSDCAQRPSLCVEVAV